MTDQIHPINFSLSKTNWDDFYAPNSAIGTSWENTHFIPIWDNRLQRQEWPWKSDAACKLRKTLVKHSNWKDEVGRYYCLLKFFSVVDQLIFQPNPTDGNSQRNELPRTLSERYRHLKNATNYWWNMLISSFLDLSNSNRPIDYSDAGLAIIAIKYYGAGGSFGRNGHGTGWESQIKIWD